MQKAIVTGATGFIGSNLCVELVKKGWDITVIVQKTSNLKLLDTIKEEISIFEYNGEVSDLIELFNEKKVDVVFHLASLYIVEHNARDLKKLVKSNLLFGLEVLEAMKESNTNLLINTGTSWQNYNNEVYKPVNLYAATKESFEKLVAYYTDAEGLRSLTLKLFDTYGEMDTRPKLINLLHKFADENKELSMSPGEQLIDLVYISDVVQAFIIAYDYLRENTDVVNEEFGVGSGNPIKLKELIYLFEVTTKKKINVIWGGKEYRKREVMEVWSNYKTLPGWDCKVTLEEGLCKYK